MDIKRGGSPDSNLNLYDQIVRVKKGWVEQEFVLFIHSRIATRSRVAKWVNITQDNCSISNGSDECTDLKMDSRLSKLSETNDSNVVNAVISVVAVILVTPFQLGILFFERFGSDKRRTIINMLMSSICWYIILWNFSIQAITIFRFLFGPLPGKVFFFLYSTFYCSEITQ